MIISVSYQHDKSLYKEIKFLCKGFYSFEVENWKEERVDGEGQMIIWSFGREVRKEKGKYDTDDFPDAHVDKVVELCAINSNEETTYHAIWSNQCVEE